MRYLGVAALFMVACAAPKSAVEDLFSIAEPADDLVVGGDETPAAGDEVLAAGLDDAPVTFAHAAVRWAPGLADVAGGLPIVSHIERPVAGKPWVAAWTTRPSAPFPESKVVVIASQRRAEAAELPGSRGAYLQVRPDHVIAAAPGSILTSEGGIIRLDLTFPPTAVGSRWFLQLLVRDARTPIGVTVSPMLELTVGNR